MQGIAQNYRGINRFRGLHRIVGDCKGSHGIARGHRTTGDCAGSQGMTS